MTNPNMFNNNDSFDINELAALNDEISPELIDQLQQKLSNEAKATSEQPTFNENDDTTLFEEPKLETNDANIEKAETEAPAAAKNDNNSSLQVDANKIDDRFDDNFVKKYKAKLNKQQQWTPQEEPDEQIVKATDSSNTDEENDSKTPIEKLTNGKILEKSLTPEQKSYNDSLDYLDGNVKYSKYVIYIDPQNVDFIENLSVKERKNLINKVLKEQGDIAITKKRINTIRTVMSHLFVGFITIALAIPIIYYAINISLEATINNYRSSQQNFKVLYKENGKITRH